MGYAATTIVMYGVPIDEDIAQSIVENEMHDDNGFNDEKMYENIYFRKVNSMSKYEQQEPVTPYSAHDDGGSEVFHPEILSDGTDSRIHSNTYEPGFQHYLGIYIASKGYAYDDQINKFVKNVPQEAIENFKNAIQPLLDKYQINDIPDIQLINQIW